MQRLKELTAKTSSAEISLHCNSSDAKNAFNEDSHFVKEGSHDTEEGSHDTKEGSHDTEEGSHDNKEGSHDSCGPTAIVVTDTDTELDQQNDDEQENRNLMHNKEQHLSSSKDHIDGHVNLKGTENDGRDTSPSTPLPTISSTIGSGLYIVGMHRKMVSS